MTDVLTVPAASVRGPRLPWSLGSVLAAVVLVLLLVAALAPSLFAPLSPTAQDFAHALQPPSWHAWFGTDEVGRDLYTRVIHGTRESLLIGVGAAGIALVLALVFGGVAALGGKVAAAVAGRLIEVVFAFPILLFALLLVAILGPSAGTLILAVGVSTAPGYARMVRGQILATKNTGYVEAARALGHGRGRIIRRHVLPNAMRPLVAIFTMSIGQAIVWASGLSFLGLGVAPPSSEWGALLDAGRAYLLQAPWLTVFPGLVILLLALAATTVGQAVQQHLETGQ